MQFFLKTLLVLHIFTGFLALLFGFIAIIVKKGGKVHRLVGKIFFFSMLGVTASALLISLIKKNQFLLFIAIFSFYQNYMGYRALKEKSLEPLPIDWLVLIVGSVNALFMLCSFNIVLMVFGTINLLLVSGNFRVNILLGRKKALPPLTWLKRHIGMMIGAYIATVTAFIVVNDKWFVSPLVPSWLPWLLPTIVLGPLIVYFTKKFTGKNV
jgi:hypothetical protein